MISRMDLPASGWTPLPQVVARRLQKLILDGEWKAGERIPSQRILSEEFNVSRASLREALLTLETLGMIKTEPGRGTYVSSGKPHDANSVLKWRYSDNFPMKDVFETRLMLETQIVRQATSAITEYDLDVLMKTTNDMESFWEAGDLLANVEADLLFHRTLAGAGPNVMLRTLYDTVQGFLAETQRQPIPRTQPNRMRASIAEHRAIEAAMRNRDAATAASAMERHIRNTAECAGIMI